MSITDGFLFFKDWEESMRSLSKKDFFELFWSMYDYQMYGKEIPEFGGKAKIVASFVKPQLKRRMQNSLYGTKGAEKKLSPRKSKTAQSCAEAPLEADAEAPLDGAHVTNTVEKETEKEKNIIDSAIEEREKPQGGPSLSERGGDTVLVREKTSAKPTRVDREAKSAYGKYGNVFLTESDHALIRATIPEADAYVDMFSEKLKSRGYTYPDHCEAILRWWDRDKDSYFERVAVERGEADPNAKYRDVDNYFELSLMRQNGDQD